MGPFGGGRGSAGRLGVVSDGMEGLCSPWVPFGWWWGSTGSLWKGGGTLRYPWGSSRVEEALPVSLCPLGERGLLEPWVLFGGMVSRSVGRPCSLLGKGKMSVTPWFCSGSGGLCRSPFGSRGCFAGHLGPLWVGDGSASTSTLLGAVGVCWGLGSLYGSGEESLWDPWLPFVGGCSARRFDIPRGPLSGPGWVGVTPLGWWVASAGPLHLAQPRTHTTLGSTRGVRRGLSASPTTSQSPAPCGSRPC